MSSSCTVIPARSPTGTRWLRGWSGGFTRGCNGPTPTSRLSCGAGTFCLTTPGPRSITGTWTPSSASNRSQPTSTPPCAASGSLPFGNCRSETRRPGRTGTGSTATRREPSAAPCGSLAPTWTCGATRSRPLGSGSGANLEPVALPYLARAQERLLEVLPVPRLRPAPARRSDGDPARAVSPFTTGWFQDPRSCGPTERPMGTGTGPHRRKRHRHRRVRKGSGDSLGRRADLGGMPCRGEEDHDHL